MRLSVVSTLYQSAGSIEEFHRRASAAARAIAGDDYEIVLVNDGSPDDSLSRAVRLADADPRLTVVDLSRNFGHHKAILAGLARASGERVFLIDSDLEEDPEWLSAFVGQMDADRCDVVFGVQRRRKGDWFEQWSGTVFYFFYERLTGIRNAKNNVTARLMTRRYVDAVLLHDEREISIGGLFFIAGFDQRPRTVDKRGRGGTTYTFRHRMSVLVDSITSFSNKPLIGIFYVGVLVVLAASAWLVYLVALRLFAATPLIGWTSVMASIWLIGGMIILFIGIVGIYLSKIFMETKRRPNSIVRAVYGRGPAAAGERRG